MFTTLVDSIVDLSIIRYFDISVVDIIGISKFRYFE